MLRKQAKRMFNFDDEIFLKAFHASPDSIIIARASDGHILEVNEGFTRTMGYTREDVLGSSTIALGVWADPQDRIDCMNILHAKRSLREREYDFRTKSGRILNCLYSGEVIELGGEICTISIVRDVTKRKQSEIALRDSEERYRTLFDNILDGVYRSTHDGRFVDVNPAMVKIFGYDSKDEMLTVDIKKELYFSEQDRQSLFLDTGQEKIEIFRMRHRNGSEIWVEDHGRYIHDAEGNVVFHEGILRDVTERVRVEEIMQLRLMLNEFAASHSLTALIQKALDEISLITNSPISFYHTVEADQKTILLQGWSTRTLDEFCQAEAAGMYYNIDQAGVWVDCIYQRKPVIHNDYASLPHRKGLPAGHAEIIRELVVPILRQGRIVSILGVGNKPTDYNEQDVELVVYIADAVWEILERKRAEEALRRQNGYLAALQETMLELLSQFDLGTLLENIVRRAAALMGTPSGYLDLVDFDTGQLKPHVGLGALTESLDHIADLGKGVAGTVWQTGKPLVVENYDAWSGRIEKFSPNTIRSVIGVPLLSGDQILGVLGLAYDVASRKAFKQEDVELLTQFARLATIAIENARLFSAFQKELAERKRAEEGLRQLSRAVEQSPASIVITDTAGNIVYVNPKFSQVTGYSLADAIGQNPRILKSGKTPGETYRKLWDALAANKEWSGEFTNRKKNGELFYESASISPITDDNGITTHYVAVKEDITPLKHSEKKLRQVNRQLQLQIKEIRRLQTKLREQAIRDFLTGLYNRRYLNEMLESELARARRASYPVSFVMIDIDRFKKINDTYGHEAGDDVLRNLSNLLTMQTRAGDIVCRYGGEEFLLVLPNTTTQAAFQIAERCRASFQASCISARNSEVRTTFSAGVASYPDYGVTGDEVLVAADNAMYQAKAQGRNRVIAWQITK